MSIFTKFELISTFRSYYKPLYIWASSHLIF